MTFPHDVVIMGGGGHVGLPLGLCLADQGRDVLLFDVEVATLERIAAGVMPFREEGAEALLTRALASGRLHVSSDPAVVGSAEAVVIVVGTPVDRYLNPDINCVPRAVESIVEHLADGQLLVLRSTVYPGVTALVEKLIERTGLRIDVAFCPERVAEGRALVELRSLPQIVSGRTTTATQRAAALFRCVTDEIIELLPEEAELAKLFTNAWRYIKFATANQLFMIANDFGLDYERIRSGVSYRYPRAADLPRAGLSAGPCLFKDIMQLAAFNNNNFALGNASVMINEGLPLYTIARLESRHDLSTMTVGILGMSFKAGSDDTRASLSYKLKRILKLKAARVMCTDPYVTGDPDLVSLEQVLSEADLLIIATPHQEYAELTPQVPTVDLSNLLAQGVRV